MYMMQSTESLLQIQFDIKPYNIDAAGHVNNAVYINWLEDMRIKLFSSVIPLEVIISKGFYLVVASTNIEYKRPLFLFDKPHGEIKIESFEKGIWFLSAVFRSANKIVAKAKQKCVLVDIKTHKMVNAKILMDMF